MTPVYLNNLGILCALGANTQQVRRALFKGETSGLRSSSRYSGDQKAAVLGLVSTPLPPLPLDDLNFQSRNNALLEGALSQILPAVDKALTRYGPKRMAIVLGTSTSGMDEADQAFDHLKEKEEFPPHFRYAQMEIGNPSAYLQKRLDTHGPALTISTACSSGAKAIAAAARYIRLGLCDAALAGGVDSLCRYTLRGFRALEAVSEEICQPFSKNRRGINLGEGAGLFLLTREPSGIFLAGAGESCDAHHFSAPHPQGRGAILAMQNAMTQAACTSEDIDYLNLHGTGTRHNDAMESLAVSAVLGNKIPCSSTKALTGHTLGAAGAIEAGLCWLTLSEKNPALPPHIFDGEKDTKLAPLFLISKNHQVKKIKTVMSNSFGFGGSNACLILRKTP